MWRANELLLCKLQTVDAKTKIIFTYAWYNESLLATGIRRLLERWYWPDTSYLAEILVVYIYGACLYKDAGRFTLISIPGDKFLSKHLSDQIFSTGIWAL